MKKFSQRVQRLNQKAAQIRQTIESVPAKIAEIREAAAAATTHVQKLRADIVSSVATLRAETDTQLMVALREIDAGTDVIAEAGFAVHRVEMDLGPVRRLIVHLERVEDVDAAAIRTLLNAKTQGPAVQALLVALIQAEELADKVELQHLRYARLTVEVGLIPSVRIGWQGDTTEVAVASRLASAAPEASTITHTHVPPFAQNSLFERRSATAAPLPPVFVPVAATPANPPAPFAAPAAVPEPVSPPSPPGGGDWRRGALDRFKKMPDLSKYSKPVS